ncbi:MAG: TusE/DsrC/DsvC family sulfur relay protein, partial [Gammaproteobacteria bacterium]|nr:TusE/DsrC/DsvC family sulfur relay protein [Gammaproteobacteria bacterium]
MLNLNASQAIQNPIFAGTFDEYGFLLNPDLWTEALAEKVAHLQGIDELSEKHWRVVKHIRT